MHLLQTLQEFIDESTWQKAITVSNEVEGFCIDNFHIRGLLLNDRKFRIFI
jgi:hypothetical protein